MNLTVEIVTSIDRLAALKGEWAAIAAAHPFQTPEWVLTWWKHLHAHSIFVRDELCACVVRDPQGALVAVAPLMCTRRPGVGPLALRVVQFIGADPNITELRRMSAAPADEDCATRAVLAALHARGSSWDWLQWGAVRVDSGTAAILDAENAAEARTHPPEYVLPLARTWPEQRSGLSRNIKESVRKCYNSLRRDGIKWELRVAATREELAAALPRFLELHAKRSCQHGTVHHRDVFRSPAARAFLADVCNELGARGAVRIFQLVVEGRVVAARLAFLQPRQLYLYFSGYEPEYGKYSVMTTLVCEAIQWAIERAFETVNLSFGTDVSKTRWRPNQVQWRGALIPPRTIRGRVARQVHDRALRLFGTGMLRDLAARTAASV